MAILKVEDVIIGGRYRALHPMVVQQQFRDVWDDREVLDILGANPGRGRIVHYKFPGKHLYELGYCSLDNFLKWAGRQLREGEASDVKGT